MESFCCNFFVFFIYFLYMFIITGFQHAGCTKQCKCKSMASSPCSGFKLFKFVSLFCSMASSLLTTVPGADEKHSLPLIRELHTMMAYYANLRDDAENREKMASKGISRCQASNFSPIESVGWASGNVLYYLHFLQ